jgi:hypothetical protein
MCGGGEGRKVEVAGSTGWDLEHAGGVPQERGEQHNRHVPRLAAPTPKARSKRR